MMNLMNVKLVIKLLFKRQGHLVEKNAGTLGGAGNKEPMQSYRDQNKDIPIIKKKKK